ncbi:hypothetical protein SAMN05421647_11440 [Marinobacterium stanieri]|uniref:Uncharacterized protein n=1 Tax=Marinobacterium stanieri TaxID=49186 RepID=A0A1N6XI08_9GAMM|nr:hypothetical protein SAMN05421647_11440 [Marinobacterium stanieri]
MLIYSLGWISSDLQTRPWSITLLITRNGTSAKPDLTPVNKSGALQALSKSGALQGGKGVVHIRQAVALKEWCT